MKLRKIISSALAATVVAGSVTAIQSFAASPRIYVNFVYENSTTIRADVMFENIPDLQAIGIHIQVGEGYDIVMKDSDTPKLASGGTYKEYNGGQLCVYAPGYHGLFFTNAGDTTENYNGRYASFYVTKNSKYSSTTATANLLEVDGDLLMTESGNILSTTVETSPIILKSDEYIIGDVDGNNTIDAVDASYLYSGLGSSSSLKVSTIEDYFTDYFPKAKSPAAPDANQNGYINKADASEILNYYTAQATGGSYTGYVGNKDIYEYYNN